MIRATTLARKSSKAKGLARMVLLVMADYVNHERGDMLVWASAPTLARDCNAPDRSIRRAIKELIEAGEIEATGDTIRLCPVYRITLATPDDMTGVEPEPLTQCPQTPDTVSATPDDMSATPDTVSPKPERTVNNRKGTGKARARKSETSMPVEWIDKPSNIFKNQTNIEAAKRVGMTGEDAKNEAIAFRDWAEANGRRYKDWNAAWRTRCNNWLKYGGGRNGRNSSVSNTPRNLSNASYMAEQFVRDYCSDADEHSGQPGSDDWLDGSETTGQTAGGSRSGGTVIEPDFWQAGRDVAR